MQGLYSIGLLIVSNVFMTLAWYGHLKLQEMKVINNWPLYGVILLSWGIALFEYCCQVPANRLGFRENGGPFSLMQLKVIQEVITLIIFTLFSVVVFKGESLHWNHIAAFGCLVLAVYFAAYYLFHWIASFSPGLLLALQILTIFFCLAGTTLIREVRMVFEAVDRSLEEGSSYSRS